MSSDRIVSLIHELESHGTIIITESDEALAEAISYELDGRDDSDAS